MAENLLKVAIVDRNQLFRGSLVEFLSLNGFQVILELSDKFDLFQKITKDNIPAICLIQIKEYEPLNEIDSFIKYLRISWPHIKLVLYSIEFSIEAYKVTLPGADAILTETTSLLHLEELLNLLATKEAILNED